MMKELGSLHQVYVNLDISLDGASGGSALYIVAMAVRMEGNVEGVPPSVSRRHKFPNRDSKTMSGAMYKLLVELDWDCSSMWRQERLPGA